MDDFERKVEFVSELTRRLHEAGTTAPRLEAAINRASRKLGLDAQLWSNPTGAILSFRDPREVERHAEVTRVMRLEPGSAHLRHLAQVDDIAERVIRGQLDLDSGRLALEAAGKPDPLRRQWVETLLGFTLASGGVAGLLKGSITEICCAAALGLLIGTLAQLSAGRPRLAASFDALAAFVVALGTAWIAAEVAPISSRLVLTSGLIVLLPGLMLTTAAVELASDHWVSGAARFAGAMAVLLKLAFGALVGSKLASELGWTGVDQPISSAAPALEWIALAVSALAFALLFKARLRDYPVVIAAACTSYLATRYTGPVFGAELSVFFSCLLISAVSNLYSRIANRPGATFRLPGLILLVPGSVGFKSLFFVFEKDVFLGVDTAFSLISLLAALVAGLLLGSSLVPPRRAL